MHTTYNAKHYIYLHNLQQLQNLQLLKSTSLLTQRVLLTIMQLSGSFSKSGPLHIGGREKVFPQTFLSELSWVIGKCKAFSFCIYVKIIFF